MKKNKLPVIFVDHGSPMRILQENKMNKELEKLGKKLGDKVKGILVISAHYETYGNKITVGKKLNTIYDFYGFPEELYRMNYDVETDEGIINHLKEKNLDLVLDKNYGIDHGAWTVLKKMFPKADKKVVLMSVNHNYDYDTIYNFGKELKSLREQGYLIIGSGNILHNFSEILFHDETRVYDWAKKLNDDIKERIIERKHDDLISFKNIENFSKAFKTFEHYKPLLYVLGATDEDDKAEYLDEQITNGSLSNNLIIFSN